MIYFYSIFIAIFLLDVGTKAYVRVLLPMGGEINVLPFFTLTHIHNTGIAFGLFQGRNLILIGIGFVLALIIFWMALRAPRENVFFKGILGMISAGAWGNLTDRILFGRVTDFLDFHLGFHHWPAFNVADSAICVGAFLLIYQNMRKN